MRLYERITSRLRRPLDLPALAWFDEDDALDQIERRTDGHPDDRRILESWVRHGYAIVENVVPPDLITSLLDAVDRVFTADTPLPSIEIADLEFDDTGRRVTLDHASLLARPVEERRAARDRSTWRIHALIQSSPAADAVRRLPELQRIASMILGFDTVASYSINFHYGSRQALHEDSAVFHLGVPNLIVGAWVACEDIDDGCGPLVYCPGSHRRPMFDGFDGYPIENLRTAPPETAARYDRYVVDEAERFEQHRFLARTGDVLFWHGQLIHGGSPVADPSTTRRSFVLHFIPRGADRVADVTGPTRY